MTKIVKKAMQDLEQNKSRAATSGNRQSRAESKISDAQHGQTSDSIDGIAGQAQQVRKDGKSAK